MPESRIYISYFCTDCIHVNHIIYKPGYYTCDCLWENDQCMSDGTCVSEINCPAKNNEAIGNIEHEKIYPETIYFI